MGAALATRSAPITGLPAAPPPEWWERLRDRWQVLLVRHRRVGLTVWVGSTIAMLGALVLFAVGLFEPSFRELVGVYVACLAMLVAWLVISPTKTLRWASVLRLFSVSILWSLVVAWLSTAVAGLAGHAPGDAGPSIAIAAIVEETFKLAPIGLLAVLAPGRVRCFSLADWMLAGLAVGMGFQCAEDVVRQLVSEPSLLAQLLGGPERGYGLSLFGGEFALGPATYAGHQIATALIALAIGFAVRATAERRGADQAAERRGADQAAERRGAGRGPARLLWWLLPLAVWVVIVADHAGFNAVAANRLLFTSGRSSVPFPIEWTWRLTGSGGFRGWLLLAGAIVAFLVDAVGQAPLADRASRAASALGLTGPLRGIVDTVEGAFVSLGVLVYGQLLAIGRGVARSGSDSLLAMARGGLVAAEVARRRRLGARADFDSVAGRQRGRAFALVLLIAVPVVSVVAARQLATMIGDDLRPDGARWFAGLLDALGSFWDGLGPGGQAMLVLGVAAILLGGALVLMPELIIGGGLVAPGVLSMPSLVITAGASTSVGTAAMAAGGVTVAGTAAVGVVNAATSPGSGSDPDGGSDRGGGSGSRSNRTPTDRIKEHLTDRDLDAARRELNGEVVARKPNGQPWDHVHEVRDAQRGLLRRIDQINRRLGHPGLGAGERSALQRELGEASRLLDRSEQFVPRR
jgi:hypothetical protein